MGNIFRRIKNETRDAVRNTRNNWQDVWRTIPRGPREEIMRVAAIVQPAAYLGTAGAASAYDSRGGATSAAEDMARDLGVDLAPVQVQDPNAGSGSAEPAVAYPQQKRKRQLASRAGTLLTGDWTGTGTNLGSTGTNLGGAGGRSTLLGL